MAEVWEGLGPGLVPWMYLRCDGVWKHTRLVLR